MTNVGDDLRRDRLHAARNLLANMFPEEPRFAGPPVPADSPVFSQGGTDAEWTREIVIAVVDAMCATDEAWMDLLAVIAVARTDRVVEVLS